MNGKNVCTRKPRVNQDVCHNETLFAVQRQQRCIFDTGAVPNIVHLRVLPDSWESYRIEDAPPVNLIGAGGRRIHQRGTVSLHVEIGRLRVRAQFLVVENLAAD
jgi:hypothetical protein